MLLEKEAQALESLAKYLATNAHKTIAFIAEPLIQGASGMRISVDRYFYSKQLIWCVLTEY